MRRTTPPHTIDLWKLEPYRISKRCKDHHGFYFVGSRPECEAEYLRQKPIEPNPHPAGRRDRFFRCSCLFKISRLKLHSAIAQIEEFAHTGNWRESR